MEITSRELAPGIVLIALGGKVMLGPESEQITDAVANLLGEGKSKILFDISRVTHLDSTGIGRFISSYNQVAAAKGKMAIAGANAHLTRAFKICRLDKIFQFFDSVEAAQSSLAGK